jgi:hypothetical protein
LEKKWAIPAHREVAAMYFKIIRAWEELTRLNIESRHLWTWIDDEEKAMEQGACSIRAVNPHIAGAIDAL